MKKPFVAAIFIIIALGFAAALVLPKYQSFQALSAKIEKKEQELQSKSEYFSQIEDVYRKLTEYQEELDKISSALSLGSSLPDLFNFLQKTAAQSGLILADINSAGIKEEGEGLKEINVSLGLAGSYRAFKNFLLSIESSARLIEVKNISFSAPPESEKSFSFQLNLKTHSY